MIFLMNNFLFSQKQMRSTKTFFKSATFKKNITPIANTICTNHDFPSWLIIRRTTAWYEL